MAIGDNIISYWKLDETSGTRYDETANSYDLTDNNTVGYATGKIGNGANFVKANSEYLDINDNADLDLTGKFTISFWTKLASQPGSGELMVFMSKFDGNTPPQLGGYIIDYYNDFGTLIFGMTQPSGAAVGTRFTQTLSNDTWYHIVFTWNGTAKICYINGISAQSESYANHTANNKKLNIGNFGYYTPTKSVLSRYVNGLIDEIGIWSRALSSTEVTSLYNSGSGLTYPFTAPTPDTTPSRSSIINKFRRHR